MLDGFAAVLHSRPLDFTKTAAGAILEIGRAPASVNHTGRARLLCVPGLSCRTKDVLYAADDLADLSVFLEEALKRGTLEAVVRRFGYKCTCRPRVRFGQLGIEPPKFSSFLWSDDRLGHAALYPGC